ncbi:carboxypeptidase-like regulatory domain-containing protein [Zeaxanthinibacter sp. PT1]|uniref:carboxypeptidase-like regulatory domain-containing protein n=1 Tax=Zeaxanthinibacter TaxID=561554 RepID=UPI00234B2908|nr:carboxypeptidase-like regulatory domain-containing protein [Zeaxanthinibacter sp. PT1]MDC6352454.1 carboxypeptidase-like regulatory domain-containing protein [Zeaxanthinibacter sp. PT1]
MKTKKLYIVLIALAAIYSCTEDTLDEERKGFIKGTVIDKETGAALDSVKITTNPGSTTAVTNNKGEFVLRDILVDDYSVQAERETYTTAFEAAAVTEGDTTIVAFEMTKSTDTNKAPAVPKLVFPEDGAEELGLEVEFIWESSETDNDELTYTLELRNGKTNEIENFEVVSDTMLVVDNLKLATNYFWEVSVSDGTADPVTSSVRQFTTLTSPDNPYLVVKEINGNNVIFSGNEDPSPEGEPNSNLYQLTEETKNSFRPRRNNEINRIAFLRTLGAETHIFTMQEDGSDVQQVTSTIPVAGFNLKYLDFSWANSGGSILYPNFDKLYSINPNGGATTMIYQTPDGSLISEVDVAELDQDLLLIKTNDLSGYNVRIFTYRLSTASEETVVLDSVMGGAGSVDISANGDKILYSLDTSGAQNSIYRMFSSRLFIYFTATAIVTQVETDVVNGENDFDARFSPSEGAVIFTRAANNTGAVPTVFKRDFDTSQDDDELFTESYMPDWQ